LFGLGIWELIIIFIVVILFVKPEDLPKFFKKVGKLYGELKKYNDDLLAKFKTIDEEIKKPLSAIAHEKEDEHQLQEEKKKASSGE
jgi:Sec-independent protein translocase protein TatA